MAMKNGFVVTNHEDFIKAMNVVNPKIKIIGDYINTKTPVEYLCECGEIHSKAPNSLLLGSRCKKFCGSNNPTKENLEIFKNRIKEIDASIEIIGEYKNQNIPIDFICACGNHHKKEPAQMLLGYTKCPACSQGRISYNMLIDKISHRNGEIEILTPCFEGYVSRKAYKIKFRCTKCKKENIMSIGSLYDGGNCSCFNNHQLKTHAQYSSELFDVNPNIELLSEYKGGTELIDFKCACGNIDSKNARELFRHPVCKACSSSKRKTTSEFVKEMFKINPYIVITGEYINAETKIDYICECGNTHASQPSLLLRGHRCGHCAMSKPETDVVRILEQNGIINIHDYKFSDCKYKNELKFDFWLEDYNWIIEVDGKHHFEPVQFNGIDIERATKRHKYTVKMDNIKNKYCVKNDIKLLRIPYWDFDKLDEIISKYIFNKELGNTKGVTYSSDELKKAKATK